jgi:hypothetical protein
VPVVEREGLRLAPQRVATGGRRVEREAQGDRPRERRARGVEEATLVGERVGHRGARGTDLRPDGGGEGERGGDAGGEDP